VAPASRPHPAVSFWGQLSGFSSTNIQYQITTWDADSNATVVTTYIDRSAKKVTEVTATAQSALNATNITINGLVQWESTATVAAPTRHYYDALGRETSVTSPLGLSSWQETRPLADALRLGTAALVCPAGV
jgi:YD repeat-containing protein